SSVLGIDSSAPAIERARANAGRNAPGRAVEFRVEDAERTLTGFAREETRFDMIILDPPALVRSRKTLAEGARKYVAINSAALQLLKPGGTWPRPRAHITWTRPDFWKSSARRRSTRARSSGWSRCWGRAGIIRCCSRRA